MVDLATDETDALMDRTNVSTEVILLGEPFPTAIPGALDGLATVARDIRVVKFDVRREVGLAFAFLVAKDAVQVFLANVRLQVQEGGKSDTSRFAGLVPLLGALVAPEAGFAMFTLPVIPQRSLGVKAGTAPGFRA